MKQNVYFIEDLTMLVVLFNRKILFNPFIFNLLSLENNIFLIIFTMLLSLYFFIVILNNRFYLTEKISDYSAFSLVKEKTTQLYVFKSKLYQTFEKSVTLYSK